MERNVALKNLHGLKSWLPDDLRELENRVEQAKQQPPSLISSRELLEIIELIQGMSPDFPQNYQQYFCETSDELLGLAISYLECLRTELRFKFCE